MHPIHPSGPYTEVLVHFQLFWCIRDHLVALRNSVQNGPKLCKSLCHEVASEFFITNASSTPLHRKPTFWCVSYYLAAFGTVWLPCETRCKMGRTSAKVRATKSHREFSQRTHPIHPIGTKTHVFVRFVLFACILDHLVALHNTVQNFPNSCKSLCHEVASDFFATNAPDPPHWTLN